MRPRLVTIPISHFCEKARWALDRARVSYEEEPHAPIAHLTATLRLRGKTVPLVVTAGAVLTDSRDILHWADARMDEKLHIYPSDPAQRREVEELEALFDGKLGPATRRWAYGFVLPDTRRSEDLLTVGLAPKAQRRVSRFLPVMRGLMKRGMHVTEPRIAQSLERIRAIFTEVSGRLEGRDYLVGARFSAADLAFAALAAPVVAPPEWAYLPPKDSLPEAMRREIDAFRATRAGQHALRMFAEER
ncbi:MAG: glutathione S-transferase [Myxococcales bacterium]|nr:glutathione S-transferase [Myxococcales bacterium]